MVYTELTIMETFMVIDFVQYVEMKKAEAAAEQAAYEAEMARREHLEVFLSGMLAELMAA